MTDISNTDETAQIARPEARNPRGFADKRRQLIDIEQGLIANFSKVYADFGFEALETPALEYADALGKFLPDDDRPNVGVFALQDDSDAEGNAPWMALRYDLTAPLARFAAQNWDSLPKPYRRYAYGRVWRNEKPGPGRLREFMQCDADTIGSSRPEADAEIIAMAVAGFKASGLSCVLKINNRKLLNGLLSAQGIADPLQQMGVLRAIDKLDRLGVGGVEQLLGAGRKDASGAFTKGAMLTTLAIQSVLDFVSAGQDAHGIKRARSLVIERLSHVLKDSAEGQSGLEELSKISAALGHMGVGEDEAIFDPAIVRGLEYYTGPVFEAELMMLTKDEKGEVVNFGSVGGGGRYDDLIARFTGERTPATGFSFGVSRLAQAMAFNQDSERAKARGPIVIIAFNEADMGEYYQMAAQIRAAGLAVEVYLGGSGMKAQMKYADKRHSPAVVMIGEDELKSGTVTIKDLDLGRQLSSAITDNSAWREGRPGQVNLSRLDAISHLLKIVG